ncbi:hypothetical protein E4U42_005491 [Claviceps africana]|uniref:Uncharacterized protein n=1 Tax=Claviceps africana TaxID=83212 RepID=A0A8K0J482_9HYPO|nr:hypothetical protein E4U42_005491 [Claviceps africana]
MLHCTPAARAKDNFRNGAIPDSQERSATARDKCRVQMDEDEEQGSRDLLLLCFPRHDFWSAHMDKVRFALCPLPFADAVTVTTGHQERSGGRAKPNARVHVPPAAGNSTLRWPPLPSQTADVSACNQQAA